MRIAIGSDHRGVGFKQDVMKLVAGAGLDCQDFGCSGAEPVDYPDIAAAVGRAVAAGEYDRGILICGTGIGMSVAANKVRGIRAALCHSAFAARRARQHNDANILCLAGETGRSRAPGVVGAFLATGFEGGRHQRRVDKIRTLEGGPQ
ncbi:MAG: ribose 5-phosphate isomerase B [Chloroflexi bacterium]|nr:ribose 5-phosphate isomerase B [Chloroflexota bacterium]